MRLLSTVSLTFEEFYETRLPNYAILSHCWGEKEVPYGEMRKGRAQEGPGLQKIKKACAMAMNRGHNWIWIDTCCIDKKSSAELSEAINSMFRWYANADECFTFLADVPSGSRLEGLKHSRWFTRGWTLQELLAPRYMIFYDENWEVIGSKHMLTEALAEVTGIEQAYLKLRRPVRFASIAQRMSWASARTTSRPEDMAYCLLGIFGVNMPLLYGEGANKAFIRLQKEILAFSSDETIFAWASTESFSGVLATSANHFNDSSNIIRVDSAEDARAPLMMTNKGLSLHLISDTWNEVSNDDETPASIQQPCIMARLGCKRDGTEMPVILVFQRMASRDVWYRVSCNDLASGEKYFKSIAKAKRGSRTISVIPHFEYKR